jgi:hypothetical protein
MDHLYQFVNIPNLEIIQEELLNCIQHDYKSKTSPHAFTYNLEYIAKTCPTLTKWLIPRCKKSLRLLRFYVTPPRSNLSIHTDGGHGSPTVPFGLNIPVIGTKDTFQIFYKCSDDNIYGSRPTGYNESLHPKDITKLIPIDRVEIVTPCFTNNSVMHNVENNTDNYRIMFVVRWILHETIGRQIEEVIRLD